jgi:predicted nucleic acid-binding protein
LQGQKSNAEKQRIKKYLGTFPILHFTSEISERTIRLIDAYSNSFGLQLPDAQVAAACLEYDLTLITYNTKDFQFIRGLKIVVPPFPTV